MQNTYRLAGHAIEIKSIYKDVHTLCAHYQVDDEAEYHISTTSADIDFERQRSIRTESLEHVSIQNYTDSYLETLAVYRKLAQLLVQEDILLMHGSVVAVDGQAYLFTAKSGTGKTEPERRRGESQSRQEAKRPQGDPFYRKDRAPAADRDRCTTVPVFLQAGLAERL